MFKNHEQLMGDRWNELVAKGLFTAMGFTEKDYNKPLIAIANTWSEANPGHYHLRQLSEAVKRGIWQAGGTPVEFNTISICDGIALDKRFHLPARDLMSFSTEIMLRTHPFKGCVFLSTCDKNVPAQLIAAARVNIPSIFVTGGPMMPGDFKGEKIVCCTDGRRLFGDYLAGKLNEDEYKILTECTHPGVGACGMMGTANTMQIIVEALGMSLPGCATVHAVSAKKYWYGENSGIQIMDLIKNKVIPSKVMSYEAFENAIRVLMAIGGSTNVVIHLLALGKTLKMKIDLDTFEKLSKSTPYICNIKPSGKYTLWDMELAGGLPAVQKNLETLLNLNVVTVTGKSLKENLQEQNIYIKAKKNKEMEEVIRPLNKCISPQGGLTVLYGNICPEGAIVKQSAVKADKLKQIGTARVFNSYYEFEDKALSIKENDIIVIRYEGPRGGPGMREILINPILHSKGLSENPIITDGRTSGSSKGLLIVHVSPEAYLGGNLAIIEDGDQIAIDIPNRTVNVALTKKEISNRKRKWKPPQKEVDEGWLKIYHKYAASANEGATIFY